MDPVTLVVTAVALGASAGLKDTAAALVKDAYAGLKRLLASRYADVSVASVEAKPASEAKRASLDEDLRDAGAGADGELLAAAQWVVDAVAEHDQAAGPAVGVDLARVKAAFLRIGSVDSEGTAVKVVDGEFADGIDIGVVRAGRANDSASSSSPGQGRQDPSER